VNRCHARGRLRKGRQRLIENALVHSNARDLHSARFTLLRVKFEKLPRLRPVIARNDRIADILFRVRAERVRSEIIWKCFGMT